MQRIFNRFFFLLSLLVLGAGHINAQSLSAICTPILNAPIAFSCPQGQGFSLVSGSYVKLNVNSNAVVNGTVSDNAAQFVGVPLRIVQSNVIVQTTGAATLNFDGATTSGDTITMSTTTAGYFHDTGGTTCSTTTLGVVNQAIGSAGQAVAFLGPCAPSKGGGSGGGGAVGPDGAVQLSDGAGGFDYNAGLEFSDGRLFIGLPTIPTFSSGSFSSAIFGGNATDGDDNAFVTAAAISDGYADGGFQAWFVAQDGDQTMGGATATAGTIYPLANLYFELEDTTDRDSFDWGIQASNQNPVIAGNYARDIGIVLGNTDFNARPVDVSDANLFVKGDGTLTTFKPGMLVEMGGNPITPFQGLYVGPDESTLPAFIQQYVTVSGQLVVGNSSDGRVPAFGVEVDAGTDNAGRSGQYNVIGGSGSSLIGAAEFDAVLQDPTSGAVAHGAEFFVAVQGTGLADSVAGVYIFQNTTNPDGPSLVTDSYGIFVENQAGATNNYAFKSGAGMVEVGDATKAAGIHVQGAGAFDVDGSSTLAQLWLDADNGSPFQIVMTNRTAGTDHYTGINVADDGSFSINPDSDGVSPVFRYLSGSVQWQFQGASLQSQSWISTLRTTLPDDADIVAGELTYWFDDTNGASKAMFKGKSANGTVVTGNIPLS